MVPPESVEDLMASQDRRFDELYSRYFREVLAYCIRRGSADDAYDTANEVFANDQRTRVGYAIRGLPARLRYRRSDGSRVASRSSAGAVA